MLAISALKMTGSTNTGRKLSKDTDDLSYEEILAKKTGRSVDVDPFEQVCAPLRSHYHTFTLHVAPSQSYFHEN